MKDTRLLSVLSGMFNPAVPPDAFMRSAAGDMARASSFNCFACFAVRPPPKGTRPPHHGHIPYPPCVVTELSTECRAARRSVQPSALPRPMGRMGKGFDVRLNGPGEVTGPVAALALAEGRGESSRLGRSSPGAVPSRPEFGCSRSDPPTRRRPRGREPYPPSEMLTDVSS
jgi:hypothetical protein